MWTRLESTALKNIFHVFYLCSFFYTFCVWRISHCGTQSLRYLPMIPKSWYSHCHVVPLTLFSFYKWQKSLLRLGSKRMWLISCPLSLGSLTLGQPAAMSWECPGIPVESPHGQELKFQPANSQPGNLLESSPSQAFRWYSPGLTAILWKTLKHNHSAKLPSGSWAQKLWNTKCQLF